MQIKQPVKVFSHFYSSRHCKVKRLNVFLFFKKKFIKSHNFLNLTGFPLSWKTKYQGKVISRPGKVVEISVVNIKLDYA